MAYKRRHPHESDESRAWRLSPLSPWRLVFADRYRRPTSWAERRQLRFRALFFIVIGVVLTLAVQAWANKSGFHCPR